MLPNDAYLNPLNLATKQQKNNIHRASGQPQKPNTLS